MATVTKDFRVKNGLVVEGSTATVNGSNVLREDSTEFLQDTVGTIFDTTHSGISFTYNDTTGKIAASVSSTPTFTDTIVFEGATNDSYQTSLVAVDPTADRTINIPNASGTLALTSDIPSSTTGLTEGTNLYFTDERAQDAIGSVVGTGLSYNDGTGAISVDTNAIQARVTNVSDTEIGYLDGVTSGIQSQLNDKAPLASPTFTGTVTLPANTITNAMMADDSVDTAEIKNSAVTAAKLATDAVETLKIKDANITAAKLATDSVETAKIKDANVTAAKLATDAVETIKIKDANVTAAKLATDSVETAKIKDANVTSAKIASDTIVDSNISTVAAIAQSKISGLTTDLGNKLDKSGGTMSGAIAMGTNKITGLGEPTNAQDAATKSYVDSAAQGIDWKASVRAATTANGTLATAFADGSTIDGVTLATGDRILVKNQTTGTQNGIYVVKASGAPDRSTDADANAEVTASFAVFVEEGSANADSGWTLTNDGSVTIGTTALTFTQFTGLGQITAGTGLTKSGNTLNVDTTTIQARVTNVSDTEIGYLDGVTSSIQTQLGNKFNSSDASTTNITEGTNLYFTDEKAQDAIGLNLGTGLSYNDTTGAVSVTASTYDAFGAAAAVTASSIGLGNVDNTSDANKPVSTATSTALGLKADLASPTFTGTVNGADLTLSGVLTATAVTLDNSKVGSALATVGTSPSAVDTWAVADFSSAKYLVQLKKGSDIEVIEVLVTVNGSNNVYITEYADVISNATLGSVDADYSGGNVRLLVTAAAASTSIKLHKTLIEA